jgi:hypothetical protein
MNPKGRPKKEGLTYFSMDVNMDDNFKTFEGVHENDGLTWMVKFWQAAYRRNDGAVDLRGLSGIIAAKNARITPEKQNILIVDALSLGLIYEISPGVYSSTGVQKRLDRVIGKREHDRNLIKNEIPSNNRADKSTIKGVIAAKARQIKLNEIKEEPPIVPQGDLALPGIPPEEEKVEADPTGLFDLFWEMYPRKEGKGAARKSWKKIKEPGLTLEKIETALAWQKKTSQWLEVDEKGFHKFIPHPTTYLNQERWMDEPSRLPAPPRAQPMYSTSPK